MGTRISLGKGFTFGASGLRYGRTIPGLRRGYVSVGRSGTLITGAHLRHWQPAAGAGTGYAAARRSGRPVRRTPAQWADIRSTTDELRASVARYEGLQDWARGYLAGLSPEVRAAMALTPEGRDALAHAQGTHPGYLRARDQLAHCEALLASAPPARTGRRWDAGTAYTAVLVLLVVGGLVWATFAQQAGFHRADQAAGLARARAVGAPGICIADNPDQADIIVPSTPDEGGQGRGHYSWAVSVTGTCDPDQRIHFVPAN